MSEDGPRHDGGFVRVYRRVLDHHVFPTPLHAHVFIHMLLLAAWRDHEVRYNDRVLTLKRGQLIVTERRLAEAFRVGREVIRGIHRQLVANQIVTHQPTHGGTVITICNYEKYQRSVVVDQPPDNPGATHEQPTTQPTIERQGKNEGKEGKEEFGELKFTAAAVPQPVDPLKVAFDAGVRLLTSAGKTEQQARAMIGKWKRDNEAGALITAISEAERLGITEPISWITAALEGRRGQQRGRGKAWEPPDEETRAANTAAMLARYKIQPKTNGADHGNKG